MEELLASRVATPKSSKRQRENDDSQILTSSRQGSVESQPMKAPGMNPLDLPRSSRDPDPRPDVPDGSDRIAKRRRVSPPSTEIGQGEDVSSNADRPPRGLSPRSMLRQIRQFFEDYRGLGDRNATVPNRTTINDPARNNWKSWAYCERHTKRTSWDTSEANRAI
ncbi:hypothetical protein ABVK25_005130 [Lepraria finkii]|uniref:Uncharacterized protein n=1 Tax=Lepraria finkii TaxID=1340010 RepID=A0ABR4BD99_9LECA